MTAHDDKIQAVVQEFVDSNKQFTSVDIANEVKTRGTWVRNGEVADYLKNNVDDGYWTTRIAVTRAEDQKQVHATLYLPNNANPADYGTVALTAMTPAEFNVLHPAANDTDDDGDTQDTDDITATTAAAANSSLVKSFSKFQFPTG